MVALKTNKEKKKTNQKPKGGTLLLYKQNA